MQLHVTVIVILICVIVTVIVIDIKNYKFKLQGHCFIIGFYILVDYHFNRAIGTRYQLSVSLSVKLLICASWLM